MSATLSKIHVTNSTGLSLNERFTAISSHPKFDANFSFTRVKRGRSRSLQRQIPVAAAGTERVTSRANQRLLEQLQRKHKMNMALKLKRRSMRSVGGGSNGNGANRRIQRGSVKAYRVGANGKAIRTNSLARFATMNADREIFNNRSRPRPLRRSNSSSNLANRLGPRRPNVGGAAERIAKRNTDRQRHRNGGGNAANNRVRSRSRSRTGNGRNRFLPRNNVENQLYNRSRSRNRNNTNLFNNIRRGRSRSRSRSRAAIVNRSNLPIKARLGMRPGETANITPNNRRRNSNLSRRGIQLGRVQKIRNSNNRVTDGADNGNTGRGRVRSRSAIRRNDIVRSRSRSRARKGQVGQQRQQSSGLVRQQRSNGAPRGRRQHRSATNNKISNNIQRGTRNRNARNGKAQAPQARRERNRSRTRPSSNGGNKTSALTKAIVNKDELDKELDQYMATTRTENEMDYLLKD